MLIIVDKKIPPEARQNLSEFGQVVGFETENICYEAISGHPDVFFFQSSKELIIAPNLPEIYKTILRKNHIKFIEGKNPVGMQYPATVYYNALYTRYGIIHNNKITDPAIRSLSSQIIHCNQAYVRCNTIEAGEYILTSDRGVEKVLLNMKINVFHIDPQRIDLPGHRHGFFGGCCGIWRDKFFVCGSLKSLREGEELENMLIGEGFEIIELYDGRLFDIGGIFFFEQSG